MKNALLYRWTGLKVIAFCALAWIGFFQLAGFCIQHANDPVVTITFHALKKV